MAICTSTDLYLLTNLTISDVSSTDATSIIEHATVELNRLINTKITRELVNYIDSTRENKIDSSNTTYYVRNWKKYLADMDNDGDVDTDDIKVYQVDSNGDETELTVSSITHDEGKFVLSSAPTTGVRLYVSYEYALKDVSTPDNIVKLACTFLTASYCYGKLNIGRSPKTKFGNRSLERDMNSPEYYRNLAHSLIQNINDSMYSSSDSERAMN